MYHHFRGIHCIIVRVFFCPDNGGNQFLRNTINVYHITWHLISQNTFSYHKIMYTEYVSVCVCMCVYGKRMGYSLVQANWSSNWEVENSGWKMSPFRASTNDKFRKGIYIFCCPFPCSKKNWEWKVRSSEPNYEVTGSVSSGAWNYCLIVQHPHSNYFNLT